MKSNSNWVVAQSLLLGALTACGSTSDSGPNQSSGGGARGRTNGAAAGATGGTDNSRVSGSPGSAAGTGRAGGAIGVVSGRASAAPPDGGTLVGTGGASSFPTNGSATGADAGRSGGSIGVAGTGGGGGTGGSDAGVSVSDELVSFSVDGVPFADTSPSAYLAAEQLVIETADDYLDFYIDVGGAPVPGSYPCTPPPGTNPPADGTNLALYQSGAGLWFSYQTGGSCLIRIEVVDSRRVAGTFTATLTSKRASAPTRQISGGQFAVFY